MRKSPISIENRDPQLWLHTFRFRREEHLKGRKEIKEVFGNGKRYGCKEAKLFVLRNNLPYNRICFTFSRGKWNAVARNRAKRLGREAFRLMKGCLLGGHDLLLLVYPGKRESLSDRTRQLEFLFRKAGLIK